MHLPVSTCQIFDEIFSTLKGKAERIQYERERERGDAEIPEFLKLVL